MPETLSAPEEDRLVAAVKQADALVDSGLSPDAAIEKVARDGGFGPGHVRLMAYAYNTGRQNGQWKDGGSVLDKLAAFQLADAEKVVGTIWGGGGAEKAAAVHADYLLPPAWAERPKKYPPLTKAAAAPEPPKGEPLDRVHKAYGQIERAEKTAEEARRQAADARDQVRTLAGRLTGYFKQASHARLPFDKVQVSALTYLGPQAGKLLDHVYKEARLAERREKKAELAVGTPVYDQGVPLTAEPLAIIKDAMFHAARTVTLEKAAAAAAEDAKRVRGESLRPFSKAGEARQPAETGPWTKAASDLLGTKTAFAWPSEVAAIAAGDILAHRATHPAGEEDPFGDVADIDDEVSEVSRQAKAAARRKAATKTAALGSPAFGAAVGSLFGKTVGSMPKPKDELIEDAWMDLEDPEHANELRKIRTHAMLSGMLTDPDDPISGHDPERVLAAYNELSQAAPRLAENAATLRPVLRKRLEAHQEPFEAKELIDMEKGLAGAKQPTPNTNILSNSPEKLLG
jgi:hypothetical protein